jgi:hypothetical protein
MKYFFNPFRHSGDNREMPPGRKPSVDGLPKNDFDVVMNNLPVKSLAVSSGRKKTKRRFSCPKRICLALFCLIAAVTFSPHKAFAIDGSSFNSETMINNLTWNATEKRDGMNEWIGGGDPGYGAHVIGNGAQLYINGKLLGYINEGCSNHCGDD